MPPIINLKFGPGTCRRHREMFVDLLFAEHGIRDWITLENIRMLFIAETARKFPSSDIRRWLTTACVGCEQQAHCVALIHALAEEQAKLDAVLT